MTAYAERLHAAKRQTARRIVAQIAGGDPDWATTPMVNDAAVYTDPDRHRVERQRLFRETPLVACLSTDLPEPGSFRLFEPAGVPILIVRGHDRRVRAFLNICGHRAAPLARVAEGTATRFTCWFHAWTYSAEGKLIGVPQREGFADCTDGRDLVPLPVEERHGLVFVQATQGSAKLDLDTHLDRFAPELAMLELENAVPRRSSILPVAANWKLVLDTYGEGYHFASLHRDTIAPNFRADIQVYDAFGPHHKITWAAKSMTAWPTDNEDAWDIDQSIGWVHYIFPNTILFAGSVKLGRYYYTLYQILPGELPGETVTTMRTYVPGGIDSPEHQAEIDAVHDATVHIVGAEDYTVAAEVWRNLNGAGAARTVVYGRQEIAVQNVQRAIQHAIARRPA